MTTIAIVGGGIAGLGAAYALAPAHRVEVFDAGADPGGHARTVDVGALAVDTGFIVYNEVNYPQLTRLFAELGVRTQPSVMSFSVECGCGVAWSSRRPWRAGRALFGEILRFLRTAEGSAGDARTLDEFLRAEGYSESFRRHYLMPMTAALWSAPPARALAMPTSFVLAFFRNHSLLGLRRRRWRTVVGGSRSYVDALLARTGVAVHRSTPVHTVVREPDGVTIVTGEGDRARFDAVVIAVPAPRALALLADPSDDERRLLGVFTTARNETVLHTDRRFLPRRPGERSAWNYQAARCGELPPVATVTYSANRLQRLTADEEYCITLNRRAEIDPAAILSVHDDEHPQMTIESHAAQSELATLNGRRRTAFAGAWQGNGFHEDGLVSGARAAASLHEALS